MIDSRRQFSPVRPINNQTSRHSDHFPVIITFENIPVRKPAKLGKNAHTIWNTNKQGGWETFKTSTEKQGEFMNIIDETKSNTENVARIEKVLTKKKFVAFGKVKVKKQSENKDLRKLLDLKSNKISQNDDIKDVDEAINVKLLELQKEEVENEIENVRMIRKNKGHSAAVFNTMRKICGDKKEGQEQVAMIDPETKSWIYEPMKIKEVSLKYCVDLLTKHNSDKKHEDYFFIQDMIHLVRCEEINDDEKELSKEDFDKRLKTLKTKFQEKYKFILKAGDGYKDCLFSLFSNIWGSEDKPQQWRNTVIVQIYKGKGSISDYNSQRNIHTKEAEPNFFEGIVVDKSKDKLS